MGKVVEWARVSVLGFRRVPCSYAVSGGVCRCDWFDLMLDLLITVATTLCAVRFAEVHLGKDKTTASQRGRVRPQAKSLWDARGIQYKMVSVLLRNMRASCAHVLRLQFGSLCRKLCTTDF